ncbi:histone-lysine N-methyltransferase SETMAR [Elysia marginata]|uniref:Histone-lysine N-methyltransferase SETMAR n=1 Tax=Elysia marginata TaxID=1093978 RepID=A0AAV4IU12_9GAST|nr:histone-lysine N-methyltransferase SETMAR [Elysia marginata]
MEDLIAEIRRGAAEAVRSDHPTSERLWMIRRMMQCNVNNHYLKKKHVPCPTFGLTEPAVKGGRTSLDDESKLGRPKTSTNEENTTLVDELIKYDRRMKIREIALKLEIPKSAVHEIVHDTLGYRKVSARWVPKIGPQVSYSDGYRFLGCERCDPLRVHILPQVSVSMLPNNAALLTASEMQFVAKDLDSLEGVDWVSIPCCHTKKMLQPPWGLRLEVEKE